MEQSTVQFIQLVLPLGIGQIFCLFVLFFKMRKIEELVDDLPLDIRDIKHELRDLSERLSRLEVRLEERTLRVIHTEKTGSETH